MAFSPAPGHSPSCSEHTAWISQHQEVPIVIGGVSKVVIEVEDQERAKRFWTETLGFEVVQDAPYGEERWLEVCTPDKAVAVVLDVRKGPRPAPQDRGLPTSNVSF